MVGNGEDGHRLQMLACVLKSWVLNVAAFFEQKPVGLAEDKLHLAAFDHFLHELNSDVSLVEVAHLIEGRAYQACPRSHLLKWFCGEEESVRRRVVIQNHGQLRKGSDGVQADGVLYTRPLDVEVFPASLKRYIVESVVPQLD